MRESNQILSEENKVLKKSNHDKDKEIAKKNVWLQKQEKEIAKYLRMIHAFTTSPQRNLARTPDSSVDRRPPTQGLHNLVAQESPRPIRLRRGGDWKGQRMNL
mmetsp:Transcript_23362/g.55157  ORF Transcript_23362/g.55157 Transcript_23362/m.55157 type:complete len:103 (-) Transcript_23362:656-964(-)